MDAVISCFPGGNFFKSRHYRHPNFPTSFALPWSACSHTCVKMLLDLIWGFIRCCSTAMTPRSHFMVQGGQATAKCAFHSNSVSLAVNRCFVSHSDTLNVCDPELIRLCLLAANWFNHWAPGHQDKWDPAGIRGSDQDWQPDRQHQWPACHNHWHAQSHQPGSAPDLSMVSIQQQTLSVESKPEKTETRTTQGQSPSPECPGMTWTVTVFVFSLYNKSTHQFTKPQDKDVRIKGHRNRIYQSKIQNVVRCSNL